MNVQATVSYIAPVSEQAYYYIHETPEGQAQRNVQGDRREVVVEDARKTSPAVTLEREGVELVPWSAAPKDEHDSDGFELDFYPQVETMVEQITGATRVLAFDHNVRSSEQGAADGTRVQAPVRLVHNDYTEASGPQRVRDLLPEESDALLKQRFAIINVWKPIHAPVSEAPLAVCDARTIRAAGHDRDRASLPGSDRRDLFLCLFAGTPMALFSEHAARRNPADQVLRLRGGHV